MAGVWHAIRAALGDRQLTLVWLPSHTASTDVGVAMRSDGRPLTAIDRAANARADQLAKQQAQAARVPAKLRGDILAQEQSAMALAQGLAQVCVAAHDYAVDGHGRVRDVAPSASAVADRASAGCRSCPSRAHG